MSNIYLRIYLYKTTHIIEEQSIDNDKHKNPPWKPIQQGRRDKNMENAIADAQIEDDPCPNQTGDIYREVKDEKIAQTQTFVRIPKRLLRESTVS
jgi:hypothetical protein